MENYYLMDIGQGLFVFIHQMMDNYYMNYQQNRYFHFVKERKDFYLIFFKKLNRGEDSFVEIWFSGSDASQFVINN